MTMLRNITRCSSLVRAALRQCVCRQACCCCAIAPLAARFASSCASGTGGSTAVKPRKGESAIMAATVVFQKALDTEIKLQAQVSQEEQMDLDEAKVLAANRFLLSGSGYALETDGVKARVVRLVKREPSGLSTTISFDINQVLADDLVNDEDNELDAMEDIEDSMENGESEENANELDEDDADEDTVSKDDDFDKGLYSSFPFEIEFSSPKMQANKLVIEAVAITNTSEETDEPDVQIQVENARFVPLNQADATTSATTMYEGPDFMSLDGEFREALTEFVAQKIDAKRMIPFIQDYSHSRENRLYGEWLNGVKTILT